MLAQEIEQSHRYTVEDLLLIARKMRVRASARLITDWVELGLLDAPDRRWLGRGRGSSRGTWPWLQMRLWETLLGQRGNIQEISTLCNVPVFAWLLSHKAGVPTRQVRRAMETWVAKYNTTSDRRARRTAKQVAGDLLAPNTERRARDAFIDAIAQSGREGGWDRADLEDKMSRVVLKDPERAKTYLEVVRVRYRALARFSEVTDEDLDRARVLYGRSRDTHAATDARYLFEPRTYVSDAANNACLDLLTIIGMLMPD